MIDPFGDQTAGFVDRRFWMVDAVQRRAGLERRHVVRSDLSQFTIGSDDGALAPAGNQTFLRHCWTRSFLRIIRMFQRV
jgi:hypothetical protein